MAVNKRLLFFAFALLCWARGSSGVGLCSHDHCDCDSATNDCVILDIPAHHFGSSHSSVFVNFVNNPSSTFGPTSCYLLNDHAAPASQFRSCSSSRWLQDDLNSQNNNGFDFVNSVTHVGVSEFWGDDLCVSRFVFKRNGEFNVEIDFNDPAYGWDKCRWDHAQFDETYNCLHVYPGVENKVSTWLVDVDAWESWMAAHKPGDPKKCQLFDFFTAGQTPGCLEELRIGTRDEGVWCDPIPHASNSTL
jgi:hypothetical protein